MLKLRNLKAGMIYIEFFFRMSLKGYSGRFCNILILYIISFFLSSVKTLLQNNWRFSLRDL